MSESSKTNRLSGALWVQNTFSFGVFLSASLNFPTGRVTVASANAQVHKTNITNAAVAAVLIILLALNFITVHLRYLYITINIGVPSLT